MCSASVSNGDCNIFNPPSFVHVLVGNLPLQNGEKKNGENFIKDTNSGAAFDVGGTSTSTFYTFLNGLRLSGRDISIYHNIINSPLTFHTNWGATSND